MQGGAPASFPSRPFGALADEIVMLESVIVFLLVFMKDLIGKFRQSLLVLSVCTVSLASSHSQPQPELSIVLEPERVLDGVPQGFTFILTNISDKNLRVPEPILDCSNSGWMGSILLRESWEPESGEGLGKGAGACNFGGSDVPPAPVIDRARSWKELKPGDSLGITADSNSLHYETSRHGIYRFEAVYLPPKLSDSERLQLRIAGITVPDQEATSESLHYRK